MEKSQAVACSHSSLLSGCRCYVTQNLSCLHCHDRLFPLPSATPSLESYARTLKHVYELVELPERIHKRMPEIQLVDMRTEPVISGFSRKLLDAIQSRLEKQEQTILLLNRRGYLPVVRCADCQDVRICPDCGMMEALASIPRRREGPAERTRRAVYATGNRWAIENFNATHG